MFQKVILVGNLGSDPEMRFLPSGVGVTNFSVATSEKWKGQDGEQHEQTTWFRVSVFGKSAEACNTYLKKGSKCLVEGKLSPDAKGNPKIFQRSDGSSGATYEIRASEVKFLSSRGEGQHEEPVEDELVIPF